MPKVATASGTRHLHPVHPVAEIGMQLDVGSVSRLAEARPACPRVELRGRGEQFGAAAGAAIRAVALLVEVLSGECPLGSLAAEHLVLRRGQLLSPFAI